MNFKTSLNLLLVLSLATIGMLAFNASKAPVTHSGGAYDSLCDSDPSECAQLAFTRDPSAGQRLAELYTPIVYLPELDRPCQPGGSSFAPLPVEAVLGNPEVKLRKLSDPAFVEIGPSGTELFLAGSGNLFDAYIDLPGDPTNPGCRFERDGLRFAGDKPYTTYARIFEDGDSERLYLQYWLFYYFNDWNNKHEGDWELIQLEFDAGSAQEALTRQPTSIGVSQHRVGEVAAWTDGKLEREGYRPVVYVARGSHANYFTPKLYLGRGEGGRGLGCDDATTSRRRVDLTATLLPSRVTGPDDPFAWLAYKGYWGEVRGRASGGSTAPTTKQNWLRPADWHEGLQPVSVSLPSREVIGPDAAKAFCDVVAFGSEFLLPLYEDTPALSLLAFATVSASILGSLAGTRYLPVRIRPLRSPRRLGQAFTSAFELYRRHWRPFVTIGLLTFPLGVAMSAFYALAGGIVSPDMAVPPPFGGIGRSVGTGLAFGGMHAGLTTLVVTAAAVMMVASLDRTEAAADRLAAEGLLGRLPAALLARAVSVLVIGALCVSVIGIPLAIRQALRWAFLEQAVLFDGHTWRGAFGASSAATRRGPYRVTATLILLGLLAMLLAPAVGIGLLMMFQSVPLAYLNLTASALYALLVPYPAIALSLLYFDLQSQASAGGERPGESRRNR